MDSAASEHGIEDLLEGAHLVSVPGRTEVAGNHQDHQGGCVLASAVDKRTYCEIREMPGSTIVVRSQGYEPFEIDLDEPEWWLPREAELHTAQAIVRGMAAQLMERGVGIKGCALDVRSDIPSGSGLSSSAAFELCVGAALLACDGWSIDERDVSDSLLVESKALSPLHLAQMALRSERAFFGKPCGIMDQISCAYGGVVHMDFLDRVRPVVTRVTLPPSWDDYAYILVDCGKGHEDETDSFAQVAVDMQSAADAFGVAELRELTMGEYVNGIHKVRELCGDLVALRGLAFFEELNLVQQRMQALEADDAKRFVELANRSGLVSAEHLQNVGFPGIHEGAMVALAICHAVLDDLAKQTGLMRGSARIHGGGFGGTIQVIIPQENATVFRQIIDGILGADSCLSIELGAPGVRIHDGE